MRSFVADSSSQPVRNLLTNPSCETASSTVVVWRNSLTNPSAEAVTSGTTILRTNLHTNPSPAVSSTGWSATLPSVTASRQTTGGPSGATTAYFRMTVNATIPSSPVSVLSTPNGTGGVRVTPGAAYTFSGYSRTSYSGLSNIRIDITWFDSGGVSVLSENGPVVGYAVNTWERKSYTRTAPATAAFVSVSMAFSTPQAAPIGATFDATAVLVEQTDQLRSYFDGAAAATLGWAYGWSGTAWASTSTAKATPTTVRTNLFNDPAATSGTLYILSRAEAVKSVVATGGPVGGPASFVRGTMGSDVTGIAGLDTSSVAPTVAVGPVSLSIWVRSNQAATYSLVAIHTATYTGLVTTNVVAAANTWVRLTATLNVTVSGTIGLRVRTVGNTAWLTGDTMDFTGVVIEQTGLIGSYFDGNTTSAGDFSYAWTGTANASASIQRAVSVSGWSGPNGSAVYQSLVRASVGTFSAGIIVPASSSTRVGVQIATLTIGSNLLASTTYTFRARVYVPTGSPDPRLSVQGTAVASTGPLATTATKNAWVELSTTFTTGTTGAAVVYVLNNAVVATDGLPFWVDAVMAIEATYPTTLGYFDGDNALVDPDLTTVWTGTAHASTSEVRGVGVAGFNSSGTQASLKPIQSTQWASSGSKSVRLISLDAATTPSGYIGVNNSSWIGGQTYTAMGRVRIAAAITGATRSESRCIQVRTDGGAVVSATAQPPNLPGAYDQRLVFTMPTGSKDLRFYNGGVVGGGDVWWDNLMLVEGNYTGPYIDGTSYDCMWEGTAHASTSVGYPPSPLLIRNLAAQPDMSAISSWVAGTGTSIATTSEWGIGTSTSMAITPTGATSDTYAQLGLYTSDVYNLKPSTTYTLSAWGKMTTAATAPTGNGNGYRQATIWVNDGNAYQIARGTQLANTAGAVSRSVITFTTPARIAHSFIRLYHGHIDGRSTWDAVMLTEGSTVYDYADGNTPGWRWEGTAGSSASIGYPYTLDSVAGGAPDGINSTRNTTVQVPPGTAFGGKTFYAVSDRLAINDTASARAIVNYGAGGTTNALRTNGTTAPLGRPETRPQFAGGGGAGGAYSVPTITNATLGTRWVYSVGFLDGLTTFRQETNNGTTNSQLLTMDPGTGWGTAAQATLNLVLADAYESPVVVYVFNRYHDDATRIAVNKWLANKYGVTLA
jgi:hypothetical protein